jgi:hypothetical protein
MRLTSRLSSVLAAALTPAAPRVAAQSGSDLFPKALANERAEGQVAEAIEIYKRIVKDYAGDRPVAAQAPLQLGRCYERLGRTEALSMREMRDVSLHPDGRQIAFTASEGDDEVWGLEHLMEPVLPRTTVSGRGNRR